MKNRISFLILLSLLITAPHAHAQNAQHAEYEVKAAFIYNFAKFIEWPADAGASLNLCVFGRRPLRPCV